MVVILLLLLEFLIQFSKILFFIRAYKMKIPTTGQLIRKFIDVENMYFFIYKSP